MRFTTEALPSQQNKNEYDKKIKTKERRYISTSESRLDIICPIPFTLEFNTGKSSFAVNQAL